MSTEAKLSLFDLETLTPVLPYGGTSGWSGSDTSEDRARRDDSDGTTGERQKTTLSLLRTAGRDGLTWADLSRLTGWHHGTASGSLSVLHKVAAIARLKETRGKCAIYVLPSFVDGRETATRRVTTSVRLLREILLEIGQDLDDGKVWEARRRITATLETLGEQE